MNLFFFFLKKQEKLKKISFFENIRYIIN